MLDAQSANSPENLLGLERPATPGALSRVILPFFLLELFPKLPSISLQVPRAWPDVNRFLALTLRMRIIPSRAGKVLYLANKRVPDRRIGSRLFQLIQSFGKVRRPRFNSDAYDSEYPRDPQVFEVSEKPERMPGIHETYRF